MNNQLSFLHKSLSNQVVSCWVDEDSNPLSVSSVYLPGYKEVWFEFRQMLYRDFLLFNETTVVSVTGHNEMDIVHVYNDIKVKEFLIRHLLVDWCFEPLEYNRDGVLEDCSYLSVTKLHPRILHSLLNQYSYGLKLTAEEDAKLNRECYQIFDRGSSVGNANVYLSLYLELCSFWEKFGLNYFDIMELPTNVYEGIRKVLSIDSSITASKLKVGREKNKSSGARGRSQQTFGF